MRKTKRTFIYLPLIDKYIFKEFLIPFVALIIGFTFLFLVGELLDDLEDFIKGGASFKTTAHYFILKLPENFRFILPISILLSAIYAMANMGKNNEITALRASGISLMRCGGSLYIFSIILTFVSFAFNETVIPTAQKKAYKIRCEVKNRPYNEFNWLSYLNNKDGRVWLFDKFSLEGEQKNVYVKQLSGAKKTKWEIQAKTVLFDEKSGWNFKDATKTTFDSEGEFVIKTEKLPNIYFNPEELVETPSSIVQGTKPNDDLPLPVILDKLNSPGSLPQKEIDRCRTILYNRLAFPWSCFISILIAIPLATKSNRSGVFGFVIKAIGIMIAYQFIAQICVVFGKNGILNPMVAGISPTVMLLIFSLYQFREK